MADQFEQLVTSLTQGGMPIEQALEWVRNNRPDLVAAPRPSAPLPPGGMAHTMQGAPGSSWQGRETGGAQQLPPGTEMVSPAPHAPVIAPADISAAQPLPPQEPRAAVFQRGGYSGGRQMPAEPRAESFQRGQYERDGMTTRAGGDLEQIAAELEQRGNAARQGQGRMELGEPTVQQPAQVPSELELGEPTVTSEEAISVDDDSRVATAKAARSVGLRPGLLESVIQHESGFNPNAKNVNDREESYGIAQLNVKGIKDPAKKKQAIADALDYRIALPKAAAKLAADLKEFGGDERLALAAYQLGKGRVMAIYKKFGGAPGTENKQAADEAWKRLGIYWTNKKTKEKTVKQSVEQRLRWADDNATEDRIAAARDVLTGTNVVPNLNVVQPPPGQIKGELMARAGEGYPGDVAVESQGMLPEEVATPLEGPMVQPGPMAPQQEAQPQQDYMAALAESINGAVKGFREGSGAAFRQYQMKLGETEERIAELEGQIAREVDAHAKAKVDPRRYWKNLGAAGAVFKMLGLALGAASEGLSGGKNPNRVLESMEKAIEQDIRLQLEEIKRMGSRVDASENLLASQYKKLGSLRAAMESTRGIMAETLKAKFMGAQTLLAGMKATAKAGDDDRKRPDVAERKEIRDTMATVAGFDHIRRKMAEMDYSRLKAFWSMLSNAETREKQMEVITQTLGLKRWRLMTGDARSERDVVQAFASVIPKKLFGFIPQSKEALLSRLDAIQEESLGAAKAKLKTMNVDVNVEQHIKNFDKLSRASAVQRGGTGIKAR